MLAKAVHSTGFRDVAEPLIRVDQLVYAGYSAGSCVAGPDLRGIELMDEPDKVPDDYPTIEPVCLGLVPLRIVPHWRSDHREAASAELATARLTALGIAFRTLTDGDAIIVDGRPRRGM